MLMPAIERYLEVRRALGYKLENTAWLLRSFARFAAAQGDTYVVGQTAIAWANQTATAHQRDRRLKTIIALARFLHAEDARHDIPPEGVFCPKRHRPVPYIFTAEEVQRLVQEARRLGPPGSLRPHTYSTLFGLLAVTGLRISEALALQLDDVTGDGLVVRETKFHKSRLVPLHESAAAALARYLKRRQQIASANDNLFVSLRRTQLCYTTVHRLFQRLCAAAGLPRQPGARRLRLHDLRHTVAVRALEACPHERARVTPHMLALTTYLGHASVRSTFWYLESTPQLMRDIADAGEAWMTGEPL
jgi:integrase/recombinase XerD